MKYILFLLTATTIFAQEMPKLPMPTAPTTAALSTDNKSILVIEPKARANDFMHAFDTLRKDKPTLKIMLRTSQSLIMNVTEITAATGGTLLYVKTLSNQGTKIQVVPIEEMMEISYSL